jgi:hypothetical protein
MRRTRAACSVLAALALFLALAAPAHAAPKYTFVNVADSARDNFQVNNFTCASINNRGDIAFKAVRTHPDGFNFFDGIHRANADGSLTTIAEDPSSPPTQFNFLSNFPSMNDLGEVSFAASLAGSDEEAILRGDGQTLTTIATTTAEFRFFGFDTSINNHGEVAFKGELDAEFNSDLGVFSGSGGAVTTHQLNSADVSLDGAPARFNGNFARPSINDAGDIAFDDSTQPDFEAGIFVGQEGSFRSIAAPDPERSVREPVLNDGGTAAFETSFFDASGQFVTAIVTGNGGPLTTVVDTNGPFGAFGFRPPAINNNNEVAFVAFPDDFESSGIFVGPDPKKDLVIATGDKLDGGIVSSLLFCEEGLNDAGQLAFVANLDDPDAPFGFRSAVFRATPKK